MSKEEAEHPGAQTRSSSMPPRQDGSEPPRLLPSTPPRTDDIDTDWGAEPAAAAQTTPPNQPVSLTFNAAAILGTTFSATGTPLAAPPPPAAPLPAVRRSSAPPPAAPPHSPSARQRPLRSQTLLGMPAPKLQSTAPRAPSTPPAAPAPAGEASATPLSVAPAEPSKRQSPLRSRTLLGMTAPLPPSVEEPPRAAMPTPVVEEQTAPGRARSSVPPPPLPPPASPSPGQRASREQTPSTEPLAAAGESRGSGRALAWLAAACVGLGVLGYAVLHRSEPEHVAAEVHATAPATPAAPEPVTAAAPSPEPSAAPSPDASAAPPDASPGAPVPGMIAVTVKSVPPKARIFHFGKQVGVAPWVVELKPGERHAYEVGLPGRVTRKLVLDGTKTEITVGLNPNPVH